MEKINKKKQNMLELFIQGYPTHVIVHGQSRNQQFHNSSTGAYQWNKFLLAIKQLE